MRKYYIETFGCQMNFTQSTQLEKKLQKNGFSFIDSPQAADIIIINACSIREHAEKRVFNRIDYFNSFKKQNKNIKLLITGCFAQNFKEKIKSDIVIGSCRLHDIPSLLKKIPKDKKKKFIDVEINDDDFMDPVPEANAPYRSNVDITKGCNNYCTYCIVPFVKGPPKSRESNSIIKEIKNLTEQGVKEIILLGQNVNAYGIDNNDISFSQLLYKINKISGIERIKFLTSHPKDFSEDIITSIFENNKVTPYIHLPIQSGSEKILKLMNRQYTPEKYYELIEKIRSFSLDYSISTDLLVGFPGETEEDFMQTAKAVKKIGFNSAFLFKYSARPYTKASELSDPIPEKEKSRRFQHLMNIQKIIEKEKAKENIGKTRKVLIDGKSKKDNQKFIGRDELNYQVVVDDNVKVGEFYTVMIKDVRGITLKGKIAQGVEEKCV